MEPVGEEEAQRVFIISNKYFGSLSLTPNTLWGTTRLALKRRQRE